MIVELTVMHVVCVVGLIICAFLFGRLIGEGVQKEQTEILLGGVPISQRYSELIMAVACKFPNETRHETALRYIQQAESISKFADEVMESIEANEKGLSQ